MANTTGVSAANSTDYTQLTTKKDANSDLDKTAFLNLLMTQLKYQDPLNPTDDKEFIGQMAQFSALEQMNNLNRTSTMTQGYALIGKSVTAEMFNSTTGNTDVITGRVASVTSKNGETYLNIDGKEVPLAKVTNVSGDSTEKDQMNSINSNIAASQSIAVIGKQVQAIIVNDDGSAGSFVEGKVDYVKFVGGRTVLSVNNNEVYLEEVVSVSDTPLLTGKKISAYVNGAEPNTIEKITGTIDSVKFNGTNASLIVGDKEVSIGKITDMNTALSYVGKSVKTKTDAGVVDSVAVRDGKAYLVVGEKEFALSDIVK